MLTRKVDEFLEISFVCREGIPAQAFLHPAEREVASHHVGERGIGFDFLSSQRTVHSVDISLQMLPVLQDAASEILFKLMIQ